MSTNPRAVRYNTRPVHTVGRDANADAIDLVGKNDDVSKTSDRSPDTDAPQLSESVPNVQVSNETTNAAEKLDAQPPVRKAETPEEIEAALAAIAAERISKRHLRRALLIAQTRNLAARSEHDAVRVLREAGIDPFSLASLVRIPDSGDVDQSLPRATPRRTSQRELARLPGDTVQLPKRTKTKAIPSTEQPAQVSQAAEILSMQQDLAQRRLRRLALLTARMFAFVLLPTLIVGMYFFLVATPMYSVRSEFVIQQAGPSSSNGRLGGLFSGTALSNSPDSSAVEGYLQSLAVMTQLDAELGFRAHFQSESIDSLNRLAPDATLEAAYRVYKRYVKVTYDTKDEVIRMEVIAADPEVAAGWSRQLIAYAEGQVNGLTHRLREDQMRDAEEGYLAAQAAHMASRQHLIELQEKFKIISSDTEISLIMGQVSGLESQIMQERLSLAQLESNPEPNQARMKPIKLRIAALEAQVSDLRARLTKNLTSQTSLAEIQGELLLAQADLDNRQMLLVQALQSMETARVEANRQVRYLSLSVSPIPPDEPTYPRAFENTLVTLMILLALYLIGSMSAAVIREQTSS